MIDVSTILQAVANGGKFTGFRLTLSEDALVAIRSLEDKNSELRPKLTVTFTTAPQIPDDLIPTGGEAVSSATPILTWGYQDKDSQGSYQVEISSDGVTADLLDTGQVVSADHFYDTSTGAFTIGSGDTAYWRVTVWDSTGEASEPSPWQEFTMTALSSLTIDSPGSTTGDLTPQLEWTFGGTQAKWKVTVEV